MLNYRVTSLISTSSYNGNVKQLSAVANTQHLTRKASKSLMSVNLLGEDKNVDECNAAEEKRNGEINKPLSVSLSNDHGLSRLINA